MMQPNRFPFLDEGEALRRLNVDRDTLLGLVRDGRLRAYSGFGKGNFFRIRDLDALYTELYGEPSAADQPAEATPGKGRPFDPGYKVHVRLQADLKWYDLTDDDLRAWVREMHEDGYPRQRTNITNTIARLQRLIDLMDEAAAGWRVLQPATPPPTTPGSTAKPTRGRSLPMMNATPAPPPTSPASDASPTPAASGRGRPLQMLGALPTPAPTAPNPAPAPDASARGRPLQMVARPAASPSPAPASASPTPTEKKPARRGKPLPMAGSPPPPDDSREGQ